MVAFERLHLALITLITNYLHRKQQLINRFIVLHHIQPCIAATVSHQHQLNATKSGVENVTLKIL